MPKPSGLVLILRERLGDREPHRLTLPPGEEEHGHPLLQSGVSQSHYAIIKPLERKIDLYVIVREKEEYAGIRLPIYTPGGP